MKLLEKYPILILLFLSLGITYLVWGDILWNVNNYLFAAYGDGIKNYYGPAYYVKYGSGLDFIGMGYPYSSYLLYVDAVPTLSIPLHWWNEYVFSIEGFVIGIVNSMTILSIIPCIVILYLIMRHYRLPVWYAMITAILIAHLSPQIHRMVGHSALAVMAFVPGVWYILLRHSESSKPYRWAILQMIFLLFFAFIHAYYLLIGVVFILAYVLVYFLQYYFRKQLEGKFFVSLLLSGIIPIVLFKVFQVLTDPTLDLHTTPYGFFVYHAEPRSILFSQEKPLVEFWKLFYSNHSIQFEGYVYIGFVSVLVLLFTLVKGAKYVFNRQWTKITHPVLPKNLSTAIWASFIVLLYSMCVPFEQGFAFVLDYLPQLQQFRSLGRFAWVFYYVFTVYAVFYLYLIFRRMRTKGLGVIGGMMLFLLFGLWAMEGHYLIKSKIDFIKSDNRVNHDFYGVEENYGDILEGKGYKVSDFQAVMAFPYFNIGSEKLYLNNRGSGGLHLACKVSYQTGLPINSIFVGRFSIHQSLKLGQIMSSPLIEKKIVQEYPNQKPLLLVAHGKKFAVDEQRILSHAKLIHQEGEEALYELPLTAFEDEQEKTRQQFAAQKDSSLFHFNAGTTAEYWSMDSTVSVVINGFEDGNFSEALWGTKALQQESGELVIFEGKIPNAVNGQTFSASIWVKSDDLHAAFPYLQYKQLNTKGDIAEQGERHPKEVLEIYKDWIKVDYNFTLKNTEHTVKLSLTGKNIVADEFLLKPQSSNVYIPSNDGESFKLNNYIINLKP